jgi:cell division protein FtsQ
MEAEQSDSGFTIDFCLKCIMTVAVISLTSLAAIFIYDCFTQSAFFNIKKIEISGQNRTSNSEILDQSELKTGKNILKINLFLIEKKIMSLPWVKSVSVKRQLPSTLVISIVEHQPLAIVKIENLSDILINTHGQPFKEYNPEKDQLEHLPVISGLSLTSENDDFLFNGPLFDSVMDFLTARKLTGIYQIKADQNIGLVIETRDIYNQNPVNAANTLEIRLGFKNFQAKLNRAKTISGYIDKHFPELTICEMDLFNLEKVFIKTQPDETLHNILEKGV